MKKNPGKGVVNITVDAVNFCGLVSENRSLHLPETHKRNYRLLFVFGEVASKWVPVGHDQVHQMIVTIKRPTYYAVVYQFYRLLSMKIVDIKFPPQSLHDLPTRCK